jgi:hypothetical protein
MPHACIKDLHHLACRRAEAKVGQALFHFGEENFAVGMGEHRLQRSRYLLFAQSLDVICHGSLETEWGHGCCA